MQTLSRGYVVKKVREELLRKYVILTCGKSYIANIGVISDVCELKSQNDYLRSFTKINVKSNNDNVIYIMKSNIIFKLSFEIVSTNVSKKVLESYKLLSGIQIKSEFNFLDYALFGSSFKAVRKSNTGGNFTDWYESKRVTNEAIESFDGLLIGDRYIRILPIVSQSNYSDMTLNLFFKMNNGRLFSEIGTSSTFTTINGIIFPDIARIISVTNEEIIFIDRHGDKVCLHYKHGVNEQEILTA